MIKTATVTWINYENYGTFLQAYALQKAINRLGYDNDILDDRSHTVYNRGINKIKYPIGRFVKFLIGKGNPQSKYYKDFKSKFLKVNYQFEADRDKNSYDVYICGSDQIWSPSLDFDSYYYLEFTDKKKIAYAPSLGKTSVTADYLQKISKCINDFHSISLREKQAKVLLADVVPKEITVVVDPTLLLGREQWNEIITPVRHQNYLLCYFLTNNKWYVEYALNYAKNNGLKTVFLSTTEDLGLKSVADEFIYAGPQEFVSYIYSSTCVMTDSFHATIFSIIFQKKFVTFKRFSDDDSICQNSRIFDLFDELEISDFFIGEHDLDRIDKLSDIPWDNIENKISTLRKKSLVFLQNAISK